MARPLELDELVEHFTLAPGELGLLRNKTGATRLGFGVVLKFVQWRGRFPAGCGELPENAVGHVARQVGVAEGEIAGYDFDGRQVKAHRAEIRRELGLRECSVRDGEQLTLWLAEHVCERERYVERVRDELLARCREVGVEPPARTRVERIVGSALRRAEDALFTRVTGRLAPEVVTRLEALIGAAGDDDAVDIQGLDGTSVFAAIRADPGGVSLTTMLAEIEKLSAVRAVGLSAGVFADVAPKVLAAWRARAAAEAPSHLRAHPAPTRLTLLAGLLWARERETTDTLVDLLISTVHRINARAEKKIVAEFIKDFERVTGKRQGADAVSHRRGRDRAPGRRGARGHLPGRRRRADPAAPGCRVSLLREHVPPPQAEGAQGVLHQPLPQGPDRAARGARVPLLEHDAPPGDRSACARQAPCRPHRAVLPCRRAGPDRWGGPRGLARAGVAQRLAWSRAGRAQRV